MLIRKIITDDNAALAKIIRTSLKEFNANKPGTVYFDETTDHLSDVFKTKRSAYYVIEIDGKIAGGGGFYPTDGLPSEYLRIGKNVPGKRISRQRLGKYSFAKMYGRSKETGLSKNVS